MAAGLDRRARMLTAALAAALVASIGLAVSLGVAGLAPAEVWGIVAGHLTGRGGDGTADAIVWDIRAPRALTAALVGAGLASAGVVMQGLTRNPLADPYLLGLSSGASLGAVGVLLLGIGSTVALSLALPIAAFAGALLALAAALGIARLAGSLAPTTVVLAGIAVSQLLAACTSLVIVMTAKGDAYRQVLSWLLGSLAGSTWASVAITCAALALVYPLLRAHATRLDAFALGDTAAEALGIPTRRTRLVLFVAVSLLTGAMVSTSGAIGFVGLILPHLVRGLVGGLHRHVLPTAALGGAVFLVWADTLARTMLDPREIPVGIVTALVGVPVFVVVLRRARGTAWT
ncbi:iron chelate uptake ABC transporter family permease subunit [Demequina sp. SYSU T00192]|uniref:Iron chelate uptake ABC transporter family permease subunit n=1 Tax=Demequina litoralis TaxID=3051660 RepID=A0ABT8G825_9MICO|nr:iron chelate uptake ABC transporter family permease subunit [Demequina sp. SYSU T00192]MDN4475307.1 iron chelate uptake ABC transporter family permease subunit [Demequina sp. SYSU T00192]